MRISDWSSDVCSSDLRGDPARIVGALGRIALRQIAPALMRAPGLRMHPLERRDADDVVPPVVAILEAQDFDPRDERVADDELELAADQLGGALRLHPRRSEARRVGSGFVSTCSSRLSPYHLKKKTTIT